MTSPSSTIVNPTPATGLSVRRPRLQVFCDGEPLPYVLELTVTRGLDQDLATAEIIYPHPLPDIVRQWSRIQILAGAGTNYVERFVGYVVGIESALWPGAKTIRCQDVLAIAANFFTAEEMDLHGFTDAQAVQEVLFGCSYNETTFEQGVPDAAGTGVILADVEEAQLFWELGQSGLECIQGIDSISLGWRTYATAGGRIVRTLIATDPNKAAAVWEFGEGIDIVDGSASTEILDPRNEITISGFDGTIQATLDPADDPFDWNRNTYWIRFQALRTQAIHSGIISPTDVALYILSQIGKPLISITFSTHLDIPFRGQEIVKVTSEHLEVDQNFWVQSVQLTIGGDGTFSQTITGISALQPQNRHMVVPPIDSGGVATPGADVSPVALAAPTAIANADVLADFTIVGIDKELAAPAELPDDTGSTYYVVAVADTSTSVTGQIVGQAWTAAGPGVRITTGSGPTFTTAFTDLDGATITLVATDSNGSEGTVTLPIDSTANPIRSRKLYALTPTSYEAFDGTEWRTLPPVAPSKVQSLGGGPWWGADHYVAYSADDLVTPPVEVAALPPGEDVTALWPHETNPALVAVGGADGSVAVSTDTGATWTQKTSLGEEIQGIIISIFREAELHVVTPSGWYTSDDQGDSWRLVRGGDFVYLELSHTRNIVVTAAGVLEKAEDGTPFTGNTSPIQAATAHIREDRFAAIALDGSTWVVDTDGSYTLTAAEPIPAGDVLPGGAYRDGQVVNLLFYAAQGGGIFKSIDFLATANGYLRVRDPSRLGP